MGLVGEQSPRAVLRAHAGGAPPAEGGGVGLAPIRGSGVQSAGAGVTARRKKLFRLPWRSSRQIRADVDEELRFHLDMRVEALVALGYAPDAARTQALREFGDLDDARRY